MFFPHNSLVSLAETEALVKRTHRDAQARDRKVGDVQPGLSYEGPEKQRRRPKANSGGMGPTLWEKSNSWSIYTETGWRSSVYPEAIQQSS